MTNTIIVFYCDFSIVFFTLVNRKRLILHTFPHYTSLYQTVMDTFVLPIHYSGRKQEDLEETHSSTGDTDRPNTLQALAMHSTGPQSGPAVSGVFF